MRIALLGSFRRHYQHVLECMTDFVGAGATITTPLGAPVTGSSLAELFVRFESDDAAWSDEMVETVALHRILSADAVFVVNPEGYLGRTTCYEIGRVIQAGRPLFFLEQPLDLPVEVPAKYVLAPHVLVALLKEGPAESMFPSHREQARLEAELLAGEFRDDI